MSSVWLASGYFVDEEIRLAHLLNDWLNTMDACELNCYTGGNNCRSCWLVNCYSGGKGSIEI